METNYQEASNLKFELKSDGVLLVRPHGPLGREDFDALASAVDPWITTHGKLQGVVFSVSKFPGWKNLASFIHHMEFINSHHRKVRRIGLAADGVLPELISKLAAHFVEAEIKQFPFAETDKAEAWASGK